MRTIEAEARGTGSPKAVWALLRVLRRPFKVRERITDRVPGERMGHGLPDGLNVTGRRPTVAIEPGGDGSVVRWRSTYESAGALTGLILRTAVPDSCKRVAKAAGR